MQRPRLTIDIHPDLGKNPARDEASTPGPRADNWARRLQFADCELHHHRATVEDIAELHSLARDKQGNSASMNYSSSLARLEPLRNAFSHAVPRGRTHP